MPGMKRIIHYTLFVLQYAAMTLLLTGCIENDIPYPYIEGIIQEIAVEDMQGEPVINRNSHTVEIEVGEDALLNELTITRLLINKESRITPDSNAFLRPKQFPSFGFESLSQLPANANTKVDARSPFTILLTTYQEYLWTISVKQNIVRSIELDKQMGEAQFDPSTHTAIAYVEKGTDLSQINIRSMKLESAKTTITPDPTTIHDFRRPQQFVVTLGDKIISRWIVDVQYSETASTTGEVQTRARRATLKGSVKSGATPVVEYRRQGDEQWITIPQNQINMTSSVAFNINLSGLTDGTTYEWHIIVDGIAGATATFTTEKIQEIPNLDFEVWTQEGRNWYANPVANNYDDPLAYWASGNEGVTSTLAGSREATTQPVTGSEAYKGTSARLMSITGVPLVGAAAGNLFIGTYKTNVGSPKDSPKFGRPFTGARPDGIRGYYKYKPMPITSGTKPGTLTMDECHFYMHLWDAQGNEIAYGDYVGKGDTDGYIPFELRLKYSREDVQPASITIVATSSHYGGDFEGAKVVGQVGNGSTLWIDEFEVIYD